MLVFGVWLVGCGRQDVVWDEVGGRDSVDDVAVAFLLFGTKEGDREDIVGPHVAGGHLSIRALARGARSASGWTASLLEPEIAEVTVTPDGPSAVRVDLAFLRAGTTDLFLLDADGAPIDVQRIAVREPASLSLIPWDDLSVERADGIPDTVHLVPDSVVSLAVRWSDATGVPLIGGELLELDGSAATDGVSLEPSFTGEIDVVNVTTTPSASPATFPFMVAAPTVSFERELRVHARDEVDRVALTSMSVDEEGVRGTVLAEVFAGSDRMTGAPVAWTFDDHEPRFGTLLEWSTEEGPATTVTACFETVCDTLQVPGRPVEVTAPIAPGAGPCGCHSAPGAAWLGALVAAGLVRRRGRARTPERTVGDALRAPTMRRPHRLLPV